MAAIVISRSVRINPNLEGGRVLSRSPFLSSSSFLRFQVKHQNHTRKLTISNSSGCAKIAVAVKKHCPILLQLFYSVKNQYEFVKINPSSVLRILLFLNATSMFNCFWSFRFTFIDAMIVAIQQKVPETVTVEVIKAIVTKILGVLFVYGLFAANWFKLKDKITATIDSKDVTGKIQNLDMFGISLVAKGGETVHIPYEKLVGKIHNSSARVNFTFGTELVVEMDGSELIEEKIRKILMKQQELQKIKQGTVFLKNINTKKMTSVIYLSFVVETTDETTFAAERALVLKEVTKVVKTFRKGVKYSWRGLL